MRGYSCSPIGFIAWKLAMSRVMNFPPFLGKTLLHSSLEVSKWAEGVPVSPYTPCLIPEFCTGVQANQCKCPDPITQLRRISYTQTPYPTPIFVRAYPTIVPKSYIRAFLDFSSFTRVCGALRRAVAEVISPPILGFNARKLMHGPSFIPRW